MKKQIIMNKQIIIIIIILTIINRVAGVSFWGYSWHYSRGLGFPSILSYHPESYSWHYSD